MSTATETPTYSAQRAARTTIEFWLPPLRDLRHLPMEMQAAFLHAPVADSWRFGNVMFMQR
jgi:hypothetical protein